MSVSNPMTVQQLPQILGGSVEASLQAFISTLTVRGSLSQAPAYWSKARDEWLVDFVRTPGNDLLAGCASTLAARVVATPVYFEGPLALALLYKNLFLNSSSLSEGWSVEAFKWITGFLNRDAGGSMEILRSGPGDKSGPALGIKHFDESRLQPTGNPEYPMLYTRRDGKMIRIHRSQIRTIVDMPDGRDDYLGVGFCSVSRSLATAHILMDIVKYKRERLSDLPPAAFLFLNNMTQRQWADLTGQYDTKQYNSGNEVWRNLLVAFGLDPAFPVKADLLEFSKLYDSYNDKDFTNLAIYTFALAFRVDPREFWPVSGGPLGTAHEADIQDKKAKSKGEGVIFSAIERAFNHPDVLPPEVTMRFDYRDTEEDKQAAEIRGIKIQNIRRMWEASLKAGVAGGDAQIVSDGPAPGFIGMITTEEARQLLILEDIVPPEVLGQQVTLDRIYDVRMYGPMARVYSDGRVVIRK